MDTPFFSIFNLTMTHESCINSKQKHEQYTKDLPEHLRINPQDIDVPPIILIPLWLGSYYQDIMIILQQWTWS